MELDLKKLRDEIDEVDQEMVKLFCRRMEISRQISAYKVQHGLPVLDADRERQKLAQVAGLAGVDMGSYICTLYNAIFELSRAEQETLRAEGAVAEALGFYLNAEGHVVGGGSSLAFKPEDIGRKNRAAAVAAGRAKAEAILAVCAHHPHKLLVVDEGAALRMLELLRP